MRRVDTYGQFCPIARGAEVFAMRWTPLIVRNMLLGCRTFGEIREGLPGISKTLLSQRLSLLEHYGILERRPNPNGRGSLYELTTAGKELQAVTNSLGAWGSRWLDLAPAHFDAGIVLWALCKTVPADDLPAARTVIRFTLRDGKHRRFWLLLDRPRAEVCAKPPGFEEDMVVETTQQWLTRWYVGEIRLGSAMRQGLFEVRGPRPLVRKLASWGGLGRIDPQPTGSAPARSSPEGARTADESRAR
jgi:DNA-binding HxlR family transcriptional regulator